MKRTCSVLLAVLGLAVAGRAQVFDSPETTLLSKPGQYTLIATVALPKAVGEEVPFTLQLIFNGVPAGPIISSSTSLANPITPHLVEVGDYTAGVTVGIRIVGAVTPSSAEILQRFHPPNHK